MTNLIRIIKVMEKTGLAKSTIWWMISNDKFPKQIKLSPRVSVWKEIDIDDWIEQQIAMAEVA
ncbi:MAG: AlpA family transcriptional regulator [Epsilonproteobacteria bacterium]|nr:MAG: AlpA family transcriptional regulator [Campylobacterota bacterium]